MELLNGIDRKVLGGSCAAVADPEFSLIFFWGGGDTTPFEATQMYLLFIVSIVYYQENSEIT